ncbi:MAG: GcrA cell cycle regulator [Phenylobacterium zucineum]|nr:MAG: GcrA cell cycle regulator [Phenylobacterium zucineum]
MSLHPYPNGQSDSGDSPPPIRGSWRGWTDAAVLALRELWADPDLSAAVIARKLGVSRNAVLGKVHRLGLSNRGRGTRVARPRPAPRPRRTAAPRTPAAQVRPGPPPVAARVTCPVVDPGPGLVERLEDLSVAACRWPIGDPKSEAFRFCGRRARAAPYCDAHRRIAFQPLQGPRRHRR